MKLYTKILSAVLCVGAVMMTSSCSDEELQGALSTKGKTPLDTPSGIAYESSMSGATISWDAVEGAGQYYYVLKTPSHFISAKGFTTSTTVSVSGLKHTTTYTLYLKALPKADNVKEYCSSEEATAEIATQVKKVWNYEWSQSATVYFSDEQNYKSTSAVFGKEKGTGKYVCESFAGVEGFDLVFTVNPDNNKMIIDTTADSYEKTTGAYPDERFYIYHGNGGTSSSTVVFFNNSDPNNNQFYSTNNENGGTAYAWVFDPNGNWTYWQLIYGDGVGDATEDDGDDSGDDEEEENPYPDEDSEDLDYSWSANGKVTFGTTEYGDATISYDAATKAYTITSWLGVAGYDVTFTRRATDGDWVVDQANSSAFGSADPHETGDDPYTAWSLKHGVEGKAKEIAWFYLYGAREDYSGLYGTEASGYAWAWGWDPDNAWNEYRIVWENGTKTE